MEVTGFCGASIPGHQSTRFHIPALALTVVRTSTLRHFQNKRGNTENVALGAGDWLAQVRREL
jgi:hypothetical protein